MIDLDLIAPDKGDKYSPNLHKWLKKQMRSSFASDGIRVYQRDGGLIYGNKKILHIGYVFDGALCGSRLYGVLTHGAKAEIFCYGRLAYFEEIPDFWQRYIAIGRCAIDTEHKTQFDYSQGRWHEEGDARTCQWCGAVQRRKRWTETVERECWEAA